MLDFPKYYYYTTTTKMLKTKNQALHPPSPSILRFNTH